MLLLPKRISSASFPNPSDIFRGLKKRKAASNEPDPDPNDDENQDDENQDDEGDGDKKKKKKSKKTKTSDDQDGEDNDGENEEDGEDEEDPEARAARGRERRRISAIMNSVPGRKAPSVALGFALETSMPQKAAIRALARMVEGTSGRGSMQERMAGLRMPQIGPDGGGAPDAGDPKGRAAAIIRAAAKARGEID